MVNRPGLSKAEREVLKVLWDYGPGTVRKINEVLKRRGRRWAYTTVATLLQRLGVKRYVTGDPSAVAHVYRAVITREELLERRLKDTAEELCDGQAAPLILALVQSSRLSADELGRLRQLLDKAAGRPSAASKSKP
jgi:predicted transcriptional regulator